MAKIPGMTKGHFILIAEILRGARDASPDRAAFDRTVLAGAVARLASTNGRFNGPRFTHAVTGES